MQQEVHEREEPKDQTFPGDGVGCKTGKSFLVILVGEVENLYKTTKPTSSNAPSSQRGLNPVYPKETAKA
jgi:hypothetical protein